MQPRKTTCGFICVAAIGLFAVGCASKPSLSPHSTINYQWARSDTGAVSKRADTETKTYVFQRQSLGTHTFDTSPGQVTYRIEYIADCIWIGRLERKPEPLGDRWVVDRIDLRLTASSLVLDPERMVWLEGPPTQPVVLQTADLRQDLIVVIANHHEMTAGLPRLQPESEWITETTLPIEIDLRGDGGVGVQGFPYPTHDPQKTIEYSAGSFPLFLEDLTYTSSNGVNMQKWVLTQEGWQLQEE